MINIQIIGTVTHTVSITIGHIIDLNCTGNDKRSRTVHIMYGSRGRTFQFVFPIVMSALGFSTNWALIGIFWISEVGGRKGNRDWNVRPSSASVVMVYWTTIVLIIMMPQYDVKVMILCCYCNNIMCY